MSTNTRKLGLDLCPVCSYAVRDVYAAIECDDDIHVVQESVQLWQLCWALAFIPVEEVRPQFDSILAAVPQTHVLLLESFFEYFLSTWITGQFQLSMWNKYGFDYQHRTNNVVESCHAHLKHRITKHPNIFRHVHAIKHEQALAEITLARAVDGEDAPKRRKKYVKLEKRLLDLHAQHSNGKITTHKLLRRARFAFVKHQ
jgi:hypothetical protein